MTDCLMDIPISTEPHQDILNEIELGVIKKEFGRYVSITNTESMYHAMRDTSHMDFIKNARFSLCDGVGVIAAGFFWGLRICRYNGPIFQLDCSEYGLTRGWRHFYYGGKEGVAEEMSLRLKGKFPGLNVVGTYCPPFKAMTVEEDDDVVRLINEAKPDFVWVGLGLLKQEQWIAAHVDKLQVPWMIGVGAAFDYHSGAVPWAPSWIRAIGFEWLFRLLIQPKLRGKRYWWSLVFVCQAAYSGIRHSFIKLFK
jgi:N-acetylglucosaminyldiphosphoundecaprenol N-acetyl-beta-D-mannosaminyltransferase